MIAVADDVFSRLRRAGLLSDDRPAAVPRYDGPQAAPGDPRAARYAAAALRNEADAVASAVEGTRNDTLNKASWKLGQLVAAGHLDGDEVIQTLTIAAGQAGLANAEIANTVPRAIRQGGTQPRAVPEADPVVAAFSLGANDAAGASQTSRFAPGGGFVLDVPETIPAIWGSDQDILWAQGESLIIAAGNGLGKTTIAGQAVRGRLGLSTTLLGLPIVVGRKKLLYLAMDRPQQIRRALRRHFSEDDRATLDERLLVWKGPPPADLAKSPEMLLQMVEAADADTLVVDSLKDAAIGLSDDEVGAGWNRARQYVIAAGCEMLELHHNVKRGANGSEPSGIADVYGSAWITAGVGSVILLTGSPGDPVVQMRHVKQPASEVGPWKLLHDHDAGLTTIFEPVDLLEVVRSRGSISARDAAALMFDKETPTPSEKEKMRRRLDRLVASGHLRVNRAASNGGEVDRYEIAAAATIWGPE